MATKRQPRTRGRQAPLSPSEWAILNDQPIPPGGNKFTINALGPDSERLRTLWEQHREEILSEWAVEHPGTRPCCWWRFDAPRWLRPEDKGWYFYDRLPEPRQRLGGTGTPCFEVLAHVPAFTRGIPDQWIEQSDDDPPVFESQAAYLKRHGLLVEGEEERLTDTDFEPEVVRQPSTANGDNDHGEN